MSEGASLRRIVRTARRIAVVGWSIDPTRPSHDVADHLHRAGYQIFPVNPNARGLAAYGTTVVDQLGRIAPPVDVVLVFRRAEHIPQLAREALDWWPPYPVIEAARVPLGSQEADARVAESVPAVFWMQLGIWSDETRALLESRGITVIEDRCFKVEHLRAHSHADGGEA